MDEHFNFDAEFRVRLPVELADKIAQVAKQECRSRNLQYVYILQNWFELTANHEKRIAELEERLEKKV